NQAWIMQPSLDGSYVTIKNAYSGRCLDLLANLGFLANGVLVVLNDCQDAATQKWRPSPCPNRFGLQFKTVIRGSANDFCLDADGGSIGRDGTKMWIWSCSGGPNQAFTTPSWPVPLNCDPTFTVTGLFLDRYVGDQHWASLTNFLGCPKRWSRLSEQNFRIDKWSVCRG